MIRDYDQIMTEWQIRQGAVSVCLCVCVKAAQTAIYQNVIFLSIVASSVCVHSPPDRRTESPVFVSLLSELIRWRWHHFQSQCIPYFSHF